MAENDLIANAGRHFDFDSDMAFEDAQNRRFHYHLLRLTAVGLTHDELPDIEELARLAFLDIDVTEQAEKIKERSTSSPLAHAIADIMLQAERTSSRSSRRAAMFGAVLGAYASMSEVSGIDRLTAATLGAFGGAVAMSTGEFVLEMMKRQSRADYLRTED